MNKDSLEYFNKQISCSIAYQSFLCDYYASHDNQKSLISNKTLLESLFDVKFGVCANPSLINDLIFPASAKMGKLKNFRPTTNKINASKYKAVSMGLAMDNLMVLFGPPGTGKTTVIGELITQLKQRNEDTRVLITSQSHFAVDNVVKGLKEKNLYLDQIARIRQKDETDYKKYSEITIFNRLLESVDIRTRKILKSFDNHKDERFGNDFLKNNVSMVLNNKSIVAVTSNSIPGCHFEKGKPFDYVIVDEAGKFSFPELMIVAKVAKRLILIGDPKQLPPVLLDNDKNEKKKFKEIDGFDNEKYLYLKRHNFIEYLFKNISPKCSTKLNEQFRMCNAIGTFISETFYHGEVSNGLDVDVSDAINFISYKEENMNEFLNNENTSQNSIPDSEEEGPNNFYEISIIKKILTDSSMLGDIYKAELKAREEEKSKTKDNNAKDEKKEDDTKKIAIIAPYRRQVEEIKKSLPEFDQSRISTVDAYQGKEYEYIIFSCTRCSGNSSFLDNWRRINVAISRAKTKIYVIGCRDYLLNNTTNIKALMNFNMNYVHPITKKKYSLKCVDWEINKGEITLKKQTNY